jgi:CRP/FNR family transcriptional regulator
MLIEGDKPLNMDKETIWKELENALPFIKKWPLKEKEELLDQVQVRWFSKGEMIHQGENGCTGVMALKEGRLKTYIFSPKGKEMTLFRLLSGDVCILSASCMMNNIVFDIHVAAEEESCLLIINSDYFQEMTRRYPEVEKLRNDIIAMRFSEVMWLVEQVMFKRMDQRIAGFLAEMVNITGEEKVQLSHQEIADNLGTAREVVSRILKYMEQDGLVAISRKEIHILHLEKLKKLALE